MCERVDWWRGELIPADDDEWSAWRVVAVCALEPRGADCGLLMSLIFVKSISVGG